MRQLALQSERLKTSSVVCEMMYVAWRMYAGRYEYNWG